MGKQLLVACLCAVAMAAFVSWLDGRLPVAGLEDDAETMVAEQGQVPVLMTAAPIPPRRQGELTIPRGVDGHFHVDIAANRVTLPVMIDTGASLLALRQSDARRAGVYVMPSDFTMTLETAAGRVQGAPVRLRHLELGPIRMSDIEAIVLEDRHLSTNLLGMNVLSEVGEVSIRKDRLLLSTR